MTTSALPLDPQSDVRFAFGKNWARFLRTVDEPRIRQAELSLQKVLRMDDLAGMSFLDVGSGSGLFSLAARRLGARVHSFDYDSNCVHCTRTLQQKFFPADPHWTLERGSVLDEDYLRSLGRYDIVYSWGVLHHSGNMHRALELAACTVAPNGRLLISIYNDQGITSARWRALKKVYVRSPWPGKFAILMLTFGLTWLRAIPRDILRLKPMRTLKAYRSYSQQRGMSAWHDLVDWAGGYPFEVAKPEEIFEFYRKRGFRLEHMRTCGGGKGCNEFVFLNQNESASGSDRQRLASARSTDTGSVASLTGDALCVRQENNANPRVWSHFQSARPDLFSGAYWRLERLIHYASRHYQKPQIVNIGTGDGYLERLAAGLGWQVTAVDPDGETIARLRGSGIASCVGVIERIPLPESSADVVFASEVFEHLTEGSLATGLREIHRVLRPEGRLIGTVPFRENLAEQECFCPGCGLSFHRWGHQQSFTPETLAATLAPAFAIERCGPVYFPSWKTMDLRSKVNAALRIAFLNPLGVHRGNENILFICRKPQVSK